MVQPDTISRPASTQRPPVQRACTAHRSRLFRADVLTTVVSYGHHVTVPCHPVDWDRTTIPLSWTLIHSNDGVRETTNAFEQRFGAVADRRPGSGSTPTSTPVAYAPITTPTSVISRNGRIWSRKVAIALRTAGSSCLGNPSTIYLGSVDGAVGGGSNLVQHFTEYSPRCCTRLRTLSTPSFRLIHFLDRSTPDSNSVSACHLNLVSSIRI